MTQEIALPGVDGASPSYALGYFVAFEIVTS